MNRGNYARLEADADRIVAGILAGRRSLLRTARRYHVAYTTFIRFWKAHTTPAERDEVLRRFAARRLEYNKKGRFRKGHRTWNAGMKGTHFSHGSSASRRRGSTRALRTFRNPRRRSSDEAEIS